MEITYNIIKQKLREYFDLDRDKIESTEAIEQIIQGVQFKGSSLWILVCAVFIASLGLNMNSTAVIIGAMLISPLMGPIMGIGLGLGINDTPLIHKCIKNLAVATLFALLTSCLYFWISPLNDARSELLARTQPTLYDVMIAFFGGFAGVIATGSRSKGNILPGVAIATALMPPLCTAGYGLATLQWQFLFEAFYLFLINAVYIGLATWLGCIVLKLPKINAPVHPMHRLVMAGIVLFVIIIPSIFTTYGIIRDNIIESRVSTFVHSEFSGINDIHMMSYHYVTSDSVPYIEVALLGKNLDAHAVELIAAHMPLYKLPKDCHLKVVQAESQQEFDVEQFSGTIIQSMIHTYQEQILDLQRENDSLRNLLHEYIENRPDSSTNK